MYADTEFADAQMSAVTEDGYTLDSSQGFAPRVHRAPDWRLSRTKQRQLAELIDALHASRASQSSPPVLVDVDVDAGDWPQCVKAFINAVYQGKGIQGSAEEFARRSLPLAVGRSGGVPAPMTLVDGRSYQPRLINDVSDAAMLVAANRAGLHSALIGPPGTGKTSATVAAFGDRIIMMNCYEGMAREDVVGALLPVPGSAGQYDWVDGPLLQAMTLGLPLLIDDAMWMPPGVQAMLHSAMDDSRRVTVIDRPGEQVVHAALGFSIIMTLNAGIGYGLSDPILSRTDLIIQVPVNFDAVADHVPPTLLALAQARQQRALEEQDYTLWVPSQRELVSASSVETVFGVDFAASALLSKCPSGQADDFAKEAANVLSTQVSPLVAVSP
ncbi:AAA family ATPase [Gordonia sihwensis]|uniref:AAA family ATPase n=1 Tax=Gordonia sihwensis TaxID=173559 RepID=UPI0018CD8B9D|nr:AAA family ATPase [Gordonia sihwensis]